MQYTLITALGIGLYRETGYEKTIYNFENQIQIETDSLLKAIIESKQYAIGKIIVIGTKTSSWDILAEELDDVDFWLRLKDTCASANGISDDLLAQLQHRLTAQYHCPVVLEAHNPIISNETIDELFPIYIRAIYQAEETQDILLDITHGFRSMSIFMYQSLLFRFSHSANRCIEIIYGEHQSETTSYIRNLSSYWNISQITEAKNRFFTQLDGNLLAEKLKPFWPSGSQCISALSGIVECNFALQIPIIIQQIRNSLNTVPKEPLWIAEIQEFLISFEQAISAMSRAEMLYKYACFLADKKRFVQAVIALQIAVEVKIITAYDKEDSNDIGNYDRWQECYKNYYYELRKKFKHKEKLHRLETLRNQIAHGGGTCRTRGTPQAVNTEHIFNAAEKRVVEFFKFVDLEK